MRLIFWGLAALFTFWKIWMTIVAFGVAFGFLTSHVTPGLGEGAGLHSSIDHMASRSNHTWER